MVEVNKYELEKILNENRHDPDRGRFQEMIEDIAKALAQISSIDLAYWHFLDAIYHAQQRHKAAVDLLYVCYTIKKITDTPLNHLIGIEGDYRKSRRPVSIDERSLKHYQRKICEDKEIYIFTYTAEDAVRDGVFMKLGGFAFNEIYMTSNLYNDGYEDDGKLDDLLENGIEALVRKEYDDSDTLKLRVLEKDKIWVAQTGEGITFMKPEDY